MPPTASLVLLPAPLSPTPAPEAVVTTRKLAMLWKRHARLEERIGELMSQRADVEEMIADEIRAQARVSR